MWETELRIILVEKQCVAGLAICREIDAFVKAACRIGFVTVIAVEFLALHRWNIRREVTLMIKTNYVGIACFLADKLKFWMIPSE